MKYRRDIPEIYSRGGLALLASHALRRGRAYVCIVQLEPKRLRREDVRAVASIREGAAVAST